MFGPGIVRVLRSLPLFRKRGGQRAAPPPAVHADRYPSANDDAHGAQPVVAAWPHDSLEERLKRTS